MMTHPLLSVIIPTHSRPKLLRRSIDSALETGPNGDIEVIVIPNGIDDSWKKIASMYTTEPRVRWSPVIIANANVARNHGLQLARGKYVRFLDDDDYLLDGARAQCIQLDISGCDVSQGGIDYVDGHGVTYYSRRAYPTRDLLLAMLAPEIFTLPHSLLWKKDVISLSTWDISREYGQDVAFAFSVARDTEVSFHSYQSQVGAWVQHTEERISKKINYSSHARTQASILRDTARGLEERSALTPPRREWLSRNLWRLAHNHFPSSPLFWTRLVRFNMTLLPQGRPENPIFEFLPFSALPPLATEWLLTPHRFIRHYLCGSKQK